MVRLQASWLTDGRGCALFAENDVVAVVCFCLAVLCSTVFAAVDLRVISRTSKAGVKSGHLSPVNDKGAVKTKVKRSIFEKK